MNAKISVFVICFEVIIFLLHNLRNGTFETMFVLCHFIKNRY